MRTCLHRGRLWEIARCNWPGLGRQISVCKAQTPPSHVCPVPDCDLHAACFRMAESTPQTWKERQFSNGCQSTNILNTASFRLTLLKREPKDFYATRNSHQARRGLTVAVALQERLHGR